MEDSPDSPMGSSSDIEERAASRTMRTCSIGSFDSAAISSSLGSRCRRSISVRSARLTFCRRSTTCTGRRMVRLLSASARATAWRIHQVA